MRGRNRSTSRQSRGGQASGAAPGIVSDSSGIVCAVGLRKLISGYSGHACRVVRASDSATLDIGFTATGEFNVAAATAFKGASTLKVVTLYDQTTFARNLTEGNDAHRPSLNLSNSDFGGKATIDFVGGSATRIASSAWGTTYDTTTACFCVSKNTHTNGVMLDTTTATATRIELYNGDGASRNPYMWGGSSGLGGTSLGPIAVVACAQGNGASDAWWVNNKTTAVATGSSGATTMDGLTLGRYFGGGSHATGSIRNVVCHSGTLTTALRQQIMQALADDCGLTV